MYKCDGKRGFPYNNGVRFNALNLKRDLDNVGAFITFRKTHTTIPLFLSGEVITSKLIKVMLDEV